MAVVKEHNKIKLREVNRHLVCRLCRGYYIDATTIAECLHSFCRSCIIKYLEKNSFCPICEVQIHKTKPYLNLRLDKALQDVVYKLVPGLYHNEMKRRREFYSKNQEQIPVATPEQCGLEERIIFSPDDSISLSLEYLESDDYETDTVSSKSSESGDNPEGLSFPQQLGLMKLKNGDGKASRRESQDVQDSSFPKRYLQCPAVVSISHLKKFIRMKHDLTDRTQVDIVHKRVPLPDHYTLMDVAYIYTWKRSAPMRFFYQICETKRQKLKISSFTKQAEETVTALVNGTGKPCANGKLETACNVKVKKPEPEAVARDAKCELTIADDNAKQSSMGEKKMDSSEGKANDSNGVTIGRGDASDNSLRAGDNNSKTPKAENDGVTKPVAEKSKVEGPKGQIAKHLVNGSEQSPREKTVENGNKDRLLLNPISGRLESVPSSNLTAKTNGKMEASSEKKESAAELTTKRSLAAGELKSRKSAEGQKEVKRSTSMNLLKSFRKEKSSLGKEAKLETGSSNKIGGGENSLTITTVTKSDKPPTTTLSGGKEEANVSIEIKSDKKESEYDFDGTSPPGKIIPLQEYSKMAKSQKYGGATSGEKPLQNSWMSLQDFRMQMLKESNGSTTTTTTMSPSSNAADDPGRKDKRKSVPSLFRIGGASEGNKKGGSPKTPNGTSPGDKVKPKKMSPTIINIKTENLDSSKTEIKIELPGEEEEEAERRETPPKPIKIESKGGEFSIKQKEQEEPPKKVEGKASPGEAKTGESKPKDAATGTEAGKKNGAEKPEPENGKTKSKVPESEGGKNDNHCGAIDLSKAETSPKNGKNPLENLMDLANKPSGPKSDENMVEALISAAQKQSIEPLLKIPHYTQNLKNCSSQGSPPLARNISSNDISQALQFFKDLRSDIKVLEAKSQLSPNSFLEQFAQKTAGLEPIQLYQQHIDLIRRLKRQQMATGEGETPPRKQAKLSPTSESKRKSSPETVPRMTEDAIQLKSSLERTLSQIQEQMELQSRLAAAQNYKNLPALLQFYNRPPSFCPSPPSPSKSRLKPANRSPSGSQKSPNSRKSPTMLASPPGQPATPLSLAIAAPDPSFFAAQKYNHLINTGLNSEMTFHQMFQNYLNQQEKMNQIKQTTQGLAKKTPGNQVLAGTKTLPEIYFGSPPGTQKKQECNGVSTAAAAAAAAAAQKT